jgi:hypothetical protein
MTSNDELSKDFIHGVVGAIVALDHETYPKEISGQAIGEDLGHLPDGKQSVIVRSLDNALPQPTKDKIEKVLTSYGIGQVTFEDDPSVTVFPPRK